MDLFFPLSKVFWRIAAPSTFLVVLACVGLILLVLQRPHTAVALFGGATIGLLLFGLLPTGNYLIFPLESRFPPFVDDGRPVDGIIQLGGAEEPSTSLAWGQPVFNDAGDRVIMFAALARRYPNARLVFSGGSGDPSQSVGREADVHRQALAALGVDVSRIIFERNSRNTVENARFTRQLVSPKPGERWLLVTSASHMPRAVGCFRGVGFPVTAVPVDYRTDNAPGLNRMPSRAAVGLDVTDIAVREWIGLVVYYLSGKTPSFFPAP